ncbi:DUF4189 domain-containing protein [Nocardia tengchongensis]|uniref:DUF4189 domain-containing protein n=1 Tax=Nocardia tengchongensis TaxID=2055889 RepID=UPI0036591E90
MRLSKKAATTVVAATAAALLSGGAGTANAAPDYYGAIAVSFDAAGYLHASAASNYPSQDEADAAALSGCDFQPCDIQVRYVNSCAAIAARGMDYWAGKGRTRSDAIAKAMAATGPDPNRCWSAWAAPSPAAPG